MPLAAVHLVEGRPETLFVRAAHVMAASEAERIGVNAAAEVVVGAALGGNSALAQHYTGLHSALKMLEERLEVLRAYVVRVQAGEAPKNHQVRVLVGECTQESVCASKETTHLPLRACVCAQALHSSLRASPRCAACDTAERRQGMRATRQALATANAAAMARVACVQVLHKSTK